MKTNTSQNISKVKILFLLFAAVFLLFVQADRSFAYTQETIYTSDPQHAPMGIAFDQSTNRLYFLEYATGTPGNPGNLRYLDLMDNNTPYDVNSPGVYASPVGVELDAAASSAYITKESSGGSLCKRTISTGYEGCFSSGLGSPKQMALDEQHNCAYLICGSSELKCIDLTNGAYTTIYSGGNLRGIALSEDGQFAYVSDYAFNHSKILRINLQSGTPYPEELPANLGNDRPCFMEWADSGRTSLYVAAREDMGIDAPYKIIKVDVSEEQVTTVIAGISDVITDLAVNQDGTKIYISTGNQSTGNSHSLNYIKEFSLQDFDLGEPTFLGVGNIPVSCIDQDGYATTDPGYYPHVTDAPFGRTLNIFGNLTNFANAGADYYAVFVRKDDGPFEALDLSWTAYKWNASAFEYEPVIVAPDPVASTSIGIPVYKIPQEYAVEQAQHWHPSFLMMRWPSGTNGLYKFKVVLFSSGQLLIIAPGELTIRVDNTPPTAIINEACQNGASAAIDACAIVDSGPNQFYFDITASDDDGHLLSYRLSAHWGDNHSTTITSDNYANNDDNPPYWNGVVNFDVPPYPYWSASENCAHTFILRVWNRTTNGYTTRFSRAGYQKSFTINNAD